MHPRTRQAANIKEPQDLVTFSWEQPKLDVGDYIRANMERLDRIFPKYYNK